jgi:hypothetical protein
LAGMAGVVQGAVLVGNAPLGVGADEGIVQKLPFLMVYIGNEQAEKDV